jgi:hypothetical protein
MTTVGLVGIFALSALYASGLDNGLARTPPMGWLSWERFGCNIDCNQFESSCISEKLYKDMADRLVELGLSGVGYTYVNIDDCWSTLGRTKDGSIEEDHSRFPRGIQWLSDYIHGKGLKFGMYTDIGRKTCAGYPGLGDGHMKQDIAQFVKWGIDSLKVDGCYAEVDDMSRLYSELSQELNSTGRPVLYSCSWPAYQTDHCENPTDMQTLVDQCNLWRNYGDIQDSWGSVRDIIDFFARNSSSDLMVKSAGPGHWNDPDMLVIGNPGTSYSEQRAQFALWAILAAPLYISSDLRVISTESLSILKNEEVIAINQDRLGRQGYVLSDTGSRRVWIRHLSLSSEGHERVAVVFENKATIFEKLRFKFNVSQIGWYVNSQARYSVRDVHAHRDVKLLASLDEVFEVDVDESSVEMFVFTRQENEFTVEYL